MKIAVAIPAYDGKLPIETIRCLLNEQAAAGMVGDELIFQFLPSCSHPAMGRNQLASDFMRSDADRLVFLDSDVTFEPGQLLKIAHYPVDFCGGAYRFKKEVEEYPVGWLGGELWSNSLGLIEVEYLPGGFLSLSRKVFETLKAAHPDRWYEHMGHPAHVYFQMPFSDRRMFGEDSFFCMEWRAAGGKVYLDPEIPLTHWNNHQPYPGHIGNWLKAGITL